ncbi:MAG: hypothetical protein A2W91_09460 [Bacteroidetes bacterium GWF2_38_335]|nr:MAG: hypothetical protein A2W91_09460 [Bacteroidetes bacterium GWF2_38_335]OFY80805.1 MAG: hypothetical protein A2281_09040 [Bacteroidetes bacterium RIFOXYA12_FULL_38_20]HBS86205.1 hypothetical protein [Bacteroidales bacterium]
MQKILFLFLIAALFAGCHSFSVVKVSEAKKVKSYGLYYKLPATALKVDVTVVRTDKIAGPYSQYASEFLGIDEVITADEVSYKIVGINVDGIPVPDTSKMFLIRSKKCRGFENIAVSPQGFLCSVNQDVLPEFNMEELNVADYENNFRELTRIKNLPARKLFKEDIDTIYKYVSNDSVTRKIPTYKKYISRKTEEEVAKDAADFIVKLRKRKSKLMMGIYTNHPKGSAYVNMISDMDKLESEYLSLFTGVTDEQTMNYSFYFVPGDGSHTESSVLFRFSDSGGIFESSENNGQPYYIGCADNGQTTAIDSLMAHNPKLAKNTKGLVYRIPGEAKITISNDEKILLEKTLTIAQYGSLSLIPAKTIKKGKKIEFFICTGGLKGIW